MSEKPTHATREESSEARIDRLHETYERVLNGGNQYQTAVFGSRLLEALLHERYMKLRTNPNTSAQATGDGVTEEQWKVWQSLPETTILLWRLKAARDRLKLDGASDNAHLVRAGIVRAINMVEGEFLGEQSTNASSELKETE